ncbi:DUF4037 domain-containing protein [Catellatospora methionotrophica]|uniref:DUF4037 domain-containing protein n=1 Tax=Catellatospora methionotrophica TaxID=121620 RepID=UPI00340ED13B
MWWFLLACQWTWIGQEEPFVGQAAEAGDELGSRMVAARLAREMMRLCLLHAKWWGGGSGWCRRQRRRCCGRSGRR